MEQALQKAKDDLKRRVAERTEMLEKVNQERGGPYSTPPTGWPSSPPH
ncbi:MAG: hypothetical protein KJ621_02065 [Proteobacteria bacterium]|nr:hypothetical protein [Pseudomonadota bacterium]MBU1742415.1 hypothetical protein [Pseudomonadota bacterium]